MNQETQGLSKQQIKSRETRAKIFQAAKRILQKQGYEQLSIKNICEEAGVSNGSFYHHFKTKDDLLSYYIEEQPSMDPDLLELPSSAAETKEAIISVYLNYVHYCEELGVEFMANYYTPKNQSLNPLIRTERPYPIITVHDYLKRVIDAGIISRDEVIRSSRFGLYSGGRYGYGLCGFTDPTIKEYLCRYTIDLGKSLGSLSGQLDSLMAYLSDYNPNLLDRLKNAEDVDTAATAFMREYEKCANQSTQQKLRTTAAEQIYNVMESYDSPVDVE